MLRPVEVKVIREVTREDMLAPLKDFWNSVMLLAHADVAKAGRVPIDTGNLRNSLGPGSGTTMIDPSPIPMWARVGTAPGSIAVKYAAYLEDGDKKGGYHYRGGPSQGKVTTGWLSSTIQNVQPDIDGLLEELADAIEREWYG